MEDEYDNPIYLAAGGIAAILLGMALVPLRSFTIASNFTFPFMALTIAVAEFGGRRAAVVTALISALSLDFFLTQPYLRLTIAGKHDIIAFLGLAACGLIAASFGSRRRRRAADLGAARGHVDLLHAVLHELEVTGRVEQALARVLDEARGALPLSALGARDERGKIVAVSGGTQDMPAPSLDLRPDTLLPSGVPARDLSPEGLPFPAEGGRLTLVIGGRQVGWLELWGSGAPAGIEARRTLSDIGRLAAVWLASGARGSTEL